MIFDNIDKFLDEFFNRLAEKGISLEGLEMDHLGYKTGSEDEYFQLKPEMEKVGKQVHENIVRGRRVGAFVLDSPLKYKNYEIKAVEIIAPLEGEIIKSGWEHVELVPKQGLEKLVETYPTLEWNTTLMNADEFPMVKLQLGQDMQAKFPRHSILESIHQLHEK